MHVRVTSPKEQSAYLAQLDDIAVKAVVPLSEGLAQTDDERKLYDALGSLNDVDGEARSVMEEDETTSFFFPNDVHGELAAIRDELLTSVQSPSKSAAHSSTPIVPSSHLAVMIFSCTVALVGLLGISLAVYIATFLRSAACASQNSRQVLPEVEKPATDNNGPHGVPSREKPIPSLFSKSTRAEMYKSLLFGVEVSQSDLLGPRNDIETVDLITLDDFSTGDNLSDDDGPDNFYDAHSDPSSPVLGLIPEIITSHPPGCHPDPPLPSLASPQSFPASLPHSTLHRHPQIRQTKSSPVSRPAWSLRAGEDTSLFVPSPSGTSRSLSSTSPAQPLSPAPSDDVLSPPVQVPRRRPYWSPIPEFDIALAMQLRPGLGIGADPAWMVRFLMAMFGWFTVLLTGKSDRQQRPATY